MMGVYQCKRRVGCVAEMVQEGIFYRILSTERLDLCPEMDGEIGMFAPFFVHTA